MTSLLGGGRDGHSAASFEACPGGAVESVRFNGPGDSATCARVREASVFDQVRGLPRVYWYLWVGQLINRVGGFVVPFLTLYLTQELKLSLPQAATVVSLYGVGGMLAGPVGGLLADKLGRKVTLVGALVSSAACMVGLGFAKDPYTIGALALSIGFTTDTYRPAIFAIVADLLPPEDRLRAYAHLYWASNLGFSIAPVVAGLLANRGYFALFMGDAATTFAFAVLAMFKIPETLGMGQGNEPAPRRGWKDLARAFTDPVFMSLLVVTFPLAVIFFQFQVTLPAEMMEHGATPAQFGMTMAINGLLIVILQPFALGRLKRYRRSRTLATASILVGAGFGLNAFFQLPWQYAFGVAIWTLGEIAHAPVTSSLVADLAPADARGRYQGAYFMVWALASSAAPLLGGWLHDPLGPWFWGMCFVASIVIAAAHLGIAEMRRERLEALRGVPVKD